MGDHFVFLVDRLITESTLEAAIESRNQAKFGPSAPNVEQSTTQKNNPRDPEAVGKWVECRICQDEDEDYNMETPCSCCGSLKYAHRRCVQRWCNEKGDTMCEICLEQFKPDYTAPPKLFHYGRIPMNFRGNWEISRRDIQNHRFIALVPNNREFLESSHYDDYTSLTRRSIMFCRVVAIIVTALFIIRHAIPFLTSGLEQYSFALYILLLLRIVAIVLPLYVIVRAVTTFYRQCFQQGAREFSTTASEEPPLQTA